MTPRRLSLVLAAALLTLAPASSQPPAPAEEAPAYTAFPDLTGPTVEDGPGKHTKLDFEALVKRLGDKIGHRANPGPVERVRAAQFTEARLYLGRMQQAMAVGRWDATMAREYVAMCRRLTRTGAALATTTDGRIECHRAEVILLKDAEAATRMRVQNGVEQPQALNVVRFERLEAEADLLRAMEDAKPAAAPLLPPPCVIVPRPCVIVR